jgi:hypothetical protein
LRNAARFTPKNPPGSFRIGKLQSIPLFDAPAQKQANTASQAKPGATAARLWRLFISLFFRGLNQEI